MALWVRVRVRVIIRARRRPAWRCASDPVGHGCSPASKKLRPGLVISLGVAVCRG